MRSHRPGCSTTPSRASLSRRDAFGVGRQDPSAGGPETPADRPHRHRAPSVPSSRGRAAEPGIQRRRRTKIWPRRLWVARLRRAPPGPGSPAAPRNDGAGWSRKSSAAGTAPPTRDRPRARLAPGAWPKRRTRGTRDAAGTQVSASQRAGSDPRGARGIDRAWSPAGAVFLVAVSCGAPVLRGACQAVSGEAHAPPEPAISARAFQPCARLVVGGSAGCVGSAQWRVGARAFLPPPGRLPPGLTPATETRPVPARRPGRWRLRAIDADTAPRHGPARSATARAPEGRPGIAPGPPWAGGG
jgi:hypothetical protein